MHLYAAGGPAQHKFILLSKTDLSPARETLKNAADAVDRIKETKTIKKPAAEKDLFFRTLADTHGTQATAIVLSGADADGAIALKPSRNPVQTR